MSPLSRGFHGRRPTVDATRVPPGQSVTRDFPVLSAGPTPHTPLDEWSFTIRGAVDEPVSWPWEEFTALASVSILLSVYSSKTRDALVLCYLVLLGYLLASLLGWVVLRQWRAANPA